MTDCGLCHQPILEGQVLYNNDQDHVLCGDEFERRYESGMCTFCGKNKRLESGACQNCTGNLKFSGYEGPTS